MSVDLLYVAWNRLEMTQASFESVLAYTDWDQVATLHIHDDGSEDGTAEWLEEAAKRVPKAVEVRYESERLGGPVAAMSRHLDLYKETDAVRAFVKLDNDLIVCPEWLNEVVRVTRNDPGVDILGIQPRFGPPTLARDVTRRVDPARHIGGIGFMRYRMFEVCRPVPNGRHGWTEFQTRHPEHRIAWILPDMACFCLDLIDLEPWVELNERYIEKGWGRRWPKYEGGGRPYFQWWADQQEAAAV